MSVSKYSIPKHPALKPGEDYYLLRKDGIGLIEKMSSGIWTDYNTHDPGITILEALCYAITDIAYRTGWDIKDILTPEKVISTARPYPDQPFFTAREILTVNPTTPDDFRRLLIDLGPVRDAWVFCKDCGCEAGYFAWCENNVLRKSYRKPVVPPGLEPVSPRGLYDVLLELESDRELGDLNDYKVEYFTVFTDDEGDHPLTLEFRFPKADIEATPDAGPFRVEYLSWNVSKSDNTDILTASSYTDDERREYLRKHWHDVFYLDLKLTKGLNSFTLDNVALRVFGDSNIKLGAGAGFFKDLFASEMCDAVIKKIYSKKEKRHETIREAKITLQDKRNLDEDYCLVQIVDTEEVAACADVEVKPEADIELVMAKIFFEVEKYFNPPVTYHTLKELLDSGSSVEDIFNGPELVNGFIKTEDLANASLKSVLYVSDILNKLMDIEGVIAVNHFQLTKFDDEGNIVAGAADPKIVDGGELEFDKTRISANWSLYLKKQHQPRLYQRGSRFTFYKNGLPFLPSSGEVDETLTQLKGEAERPKITGSTDISNDLPVPLGKFRNLEDYFPVQYSFPITYGIGQDGLPHNATDKRRGQAAQLKAYLMVFEQLLANACTQVAHTADLFSLDAKLTQTYFANKLSEAILLGYDKIVAAGLDSAALTGLNETPLEFHKRRNRFLDHIMSRFGEQFNEYALLLTNLEGQSVARDALIEDKIAFLRAYPMISHDRARAFNYRKPAPVEYTPAGAAVKLNQPGIKARVSRLTGRPDLILNWVETAATGIDKYRLKFQIAERGSIVLAGSITIHANDPEAAEIHGYQAIADRISRNENFAVVPASGKYELRLKGNVDEAHGKAPELFNTATDAVLIRNDLVAWASSERVIVVEHLLLRPKFPGDALYASCCCDEDPFSFRLTFVMPGWNEPFKSNMDMRSFVDRTIRYETPSHLLPKICWVDTDPMDRFEASWYRWLQANAAFDWTEERLEDRLGIVLKHSLLPGIEPGSAAGDVCDCARDILARYGKKYFEWMVKQRTAGLKLEAIKKLKVPAPDAMLCPAKYKSDVSKQVEHFIIEHYTSYLEVSFLLWDVVELLENLNNIYPPATLHDWAEGDDDNPARLGKTALGS